MAKTSARGCRHASGAGRTAWVKLSPSTALGCRTSRSGIAATSAAMRERRGNRFGDGLFQFRSRRGGRISSSSTLFPYRPWFGDNRRQGFRRLDEAADDPVVRATGEGWRHMRCRAVEGRNQSLSIWAHRRRRVWVGISASAARPHDSSLLFIDGWEVCGWTDAVGNAVAETLDNEAQQDNQLMPPPKAPSRAVGTIVSLFAVAAVGAGSVCAALKFHQFAEQSLNQTASAPIPDPVVSALLKDIQSSQQKSTATLDTLAQSSTAEQADLKRISAQLSSLTARVDALQNATAPETTSAIPMPNPRTRVVRTARRKSSQLPDPVGPVSVGGAPLGPAPISSDPLKL